MLRLLQMAAQLLDVVLNRKKMKVITQEAQHILKLNVAISKGGRVSRLYA